MSEKTFFKNKICIVTDVAKEEEVNKLIETAFTQYGKIDLLIKNAAIVADREFQDAGLEYWKKIIDTNLWGMVHGTYAVYPGMMKQGFGQIVNVSSPAGLLPGSLMTSYTASKRLIEQDF